MKTSGKLKKRWKILLTLAAMMICGGIAYWCLKDEYGEGYDEEMRRLMNEQLEVLPMGTVIWPLSVVVSEDEARKNQEDLESSEDRKRRLEEEYPYEYQLMKRHKELVKERPASCPFIVNETPDITNLPLGGLTMAEIKKRAEEYHDADACLYLASDYYQSLYYRFLMRKKWLDKAVQLGRPGAKFLLSVVLEQEKRLFDFFTLPPNLKLEIAFLDDRYLLEDDVYQLEGFDEFRQLVLNGDFKLYEVLSTLECMFYIDDFMVDKDVKKGNFKNEVVLALSEAAKGGNQEAARIFANNILPFYIEMNATKDGYYSPPESLEKCIDYLEPWIDLKPFFKKTPYRDRFAQISKTLKKGADEGDLDSMHLWLCQGIRYQQFYSKSTWKDIFAYSSALLEAGHVGFMKELSMPENYNSSPVAAIFSLYYGDMSDVQVSIDRSLKKRRDYERRPDTDQEMRHWLQSIASGDVSELYWGVRDGRYAVLTIDAGELLPLIKPIADMGDPAAMFFVADQTLGTGAKGETVKQAYEYLERAFKLCEKYDDFCESWNRLLVNGDVLGPRSNGSLADSIMGRLLLLRMDYDSELTDHAKAIELLDQYEQFSKTMYPHRKYKHVLFYKGVIFEYGIGVEQDMDKAQEFYNQVELIDNDLLEARKRFKDKLNIPSK